jgi:hypothetical protein
LPAGQVQRGSRRFDPDQESIRAGAVLPGNIALQIGMRMVLLALAGFVLVTRDARPQVYPHRRKALHVARCMSCHDMCIRIRADADARWQKRVSLHWNAKDADQIARHIASRCYGLKRADQC